MEYYGDISPDRLEITLITVGTSYITRVDSWSYTSVDAYEKAVQDRVLRATSDYIQPVTVIRMKVVEAYNSTSVRKIIREDLLSPVKQEPEDKPVSIEV